MRVHREDGGKLYNNVPPMQRDHHKTDVIYEVLSTQNVMCDCFSMHMFFVLQTATTNEVRGVQVLYIYLVWCHVVRYLFVEMILTVHFRF